MKTRGIHRENGVSKDPDFALFGTVMLKLEQNQKLLTENQSKMNAILHNKIEAVVATQGIKNTQFTEDISQLKTEIQKLKSKSGGSFKTVRFTNIAKKKSSKQPGSAQIHRTGEAEDLEFIVSEDDKGRYDCPVCKRNLAASYIRHHLRKICLKGTVYISKVNDNLG